MIPVRAQPEPGDFDARVRQPGLTWLRRKRGGRVALTTPLARKGAPGYKRDFWKGGDQWRHALDDLRAAYGSICAYAALRVPDTTGFGSVDHWVTKAARPDLAYEWLNFRFACGRVNGKKGEATDVLDPFQVRAGWFHLEFTALSIYADPAQTRAVQQVVQATIDRLDLDSPGYRADRQGRWDQYLGALSAGADPAWAARQLLDEAPHVHAEAARQRLLR